MEKTHHICSRIKRGRNKDLVWWFEIRFALLSWMLEKQSQNNKRRRIWCLKCLRWRHENCSHYTDKCTHYETEAELIKDRSDYYTGSIVLRDSCFHTFLKVEFFSHIASKAFKRPIFHSPYRILITSKQIPKLSF